MTEPITISEAKAAARIDADDRGFDRYIDTAIVAARKAAEHITQRVYVAATVEIALRDWPGRTEILRAPNVSETAIEYWDGTAWVTLDTDSYTVEPYKGGTLVWSDSFPTLGDKPGDRVRITFDADATAAPECVKLYCMACVAAWIADPESQQSKALTPNPMFERLLDPERVWG